MTTTTPTWGTELERTTVLGRPVLAYRERPRSLLSLLDDAERWGARTHLTEGERHVTFSGLRVAVDRVADRLAAAAVEPGDRVLLLARNSLEWVAGFWGIVRLGAVAALGNAWWSGPEVSHAIGLLAPRLVLADEPRAEVVGGTAPVLGIEMLRPLLEPAGPEPSPSPAPPCVDEDDIAVILFTSGTTGPSKGAQLTHRGLIANQHNFLSRTGRLPSGLPDDHPVVTSLLSTPLFHTGGVQSILTALVTGGRLAFLLERFSAEAVMGLIERERVTVWAGVPTMVQRVVQHPDARSRDLSSVRAVGFGGAPVPPSLVAATAEVFPRAHRGVSTNYGSTEAGGIVTTAAGQDVLSRPGTSGRSLPGVELAIAEPDDQGRGEILVRSAAVFAGYFDDDERVVDLEGWLHTGDIGRLDADGYLFVVDRLKDIIIRGGENIACPNVEAALLAHPGVLAAAALGLPHHDLGEEVGAVVVVASGGAPGADELERFAAARLARFEVPSRWWVRREPLPETVTGKVDKRRLRAEWQDHAPAAQ